MKLVVSDRAMSFIRERGGSVWVWLDPHRGLVTTEWAKAKRRGVLVDANQNGEGKTIASAYSVRPNAGAPVSTPLRWEEVTEGLDPTAFTMEGGLTGEAARWIPAEVAR